MPDPVSQLQYRSRRDEPRPASVYRVFAGVALLALAVGVGLVFLRAMALTLLHDPYLAPPSSGYGAALMLILLGTFSVVLIVVLVRQAFRQFAGRPQAGADR